MPDTTALAQCPRCWETAVNATDPNGYKYRVCRACGHTVPDPGASRCRVRDQGEDSPFAHRYLARGDGMAMSSWSPAAALAKWRRHRRESDLRASGLDVGGEGEHGGPTT